MVRRSKVGNENIFSNHTELRICETIGHFKRGDQERERHYLLDLEGIRNLLFVEGVYHPIERREFLYLF